MSKNEIKRVLFGLNASIISCRKNKKARDNRTGRRDIKGWNTLEELEKQGLLD
jgi:hypothetical protein